MTWVRTYTAQQVLDAVNAQPDHRILLRDLREVFSVDPSTLQRYINELEGLGLVTRTYLAQPGRPCRVVAVGSVVPAGHEARQGRSEALEGPAPTPAPASAPVALTACPWCGGSGDLPADPTTGELEPCPECSGSGQVAL